MRIFFLLLTLSCALHAQPLPSEAQQLERIRKYEQIVKDSPRDVEFRHELAGYYRDAEMWDQAIATETEAIRQFPKYAAAIYGRGKAKAGKEDYAGAAEDFTAAIKLCELRGGVEYYLTVEQPSEIYIDAYRSRGVAVSHLNRYPDGIADLTIAMKLRKDDPKLTYERGYLEEKAGRKGEAVADYARAGMVYADGHARPSAIECATRLDSLGAKTEAEAVRARLAPKKPKSDLP